MANKRRVDLVKKFVIGLGFLNGLWIAVGIDPSDEIFKILQPILSQLHPAIKTLFIVLPILITLLTFLGIFLMYKKGGWVGSLAVLIAFISGVLVLWSIIISAILLLIAFIIGVLVFKDG